jgi:CheY-like chemotaxis protein/DNA-binding Xre family transcriptional regulator
MPTQPFAVFSFSIGYIESCSVTYRLLRRLLTWRRKSKVFVQMFDVKKSFGSSVKTWRGRLGISQEELAERAGLHRTYISDIERGARNISLHNIDKLAAALEISVSTLFAYDRELPEAKLAANRLNPDELVDILYVEDEPNDVELTLRALEAARITNRVYVAADGAEALDFLFRAGKHAHRHPADRPQVILLDLNLPRINGLEVLRRVKADPRTCSIPVVVLTVSKSSGDILASKQLGAEAYIVKPVDFQNLSQVTPQLCFQWALLKPVKLLNT